MTCHCIPRPSPLYFIEQRFRRGDCAFLELDRDLNSRASVLEMIRSGEVHPVKVLEIDETEGTVRDCLNDDDFIEALAELRAFARPDASDMQAVKWDHARELRNAE